MSTTSTHPAVLTEYLRGEDGLPSYSVKMATQPQGFGPQHPFAAAWPVSVTTGTYTVRVGAKVVGVGPREAALATLEKFADAIAAKGA